MLWNTMRAVEELSLCPGIVELSPKNCTGTFLDAKRSERRNYKFNSVLGGTLTTEAMDWGKSATDLSATESIYKRVWLATTYCFHFDKTLQSCSPYFLSFLHVFLLLLF